jgi:hypothetical protein
MKRSLKFWCCFTSKSLSTANGAHAWHQALKATMARKPCNGELPKLRASARD